MRILLRLWVIGWVLVGIALLAWPADLPAQAITGKIAGRVTDARTGDPLPGANVALTGTPRGATSDVNGEYFILNVTPGVYALRVSIVGYQAVSKTGVAVSVDRTTSVDFALKETAVELAEIKVVAERPPVEMDVSNTQTILSAQNVQEAPVGPRLRDAFATRVGLDTDDWGLTIRGGNEEEILYMVDGVGLKDNRHNRPYSSYSKTALQEVQVLTGGFNAEYGDVRSGVVNVVNREPRKWTISAEARYGGPGNKHFGPAIYSPDNWWDVGRFQSMGPAEDRDRDGKPDFDGWQKTWESRGGPAKRFKAGIFEDPITTPQQAKAIWDWQHRTIPENFQQNLNPKERDSDYTYDVTAGGPLIGDKISFLLSNRRERTAYTWGLAVPNYRDDTVQGRLIYAPTSTAKLTLGYLRGWSQGAKFDNFLGEFARSPQAEANNLRTRNIFAMGSGSNIETITRNYGTLTWTHTLSPKTFYNITARSGKVDWTASWQPPQKRGVAAAAVFPDGRTEKITEGQAAAARAQGAVILDEAPLGFVYRPPARDILGLYNVRGSDGNLSRSSDWSYIYENDFTADVTSQVTRNHQLKGGVQVHHFYLREFRGFVSTIEDPTKAASGYRPEGLEDDPAKVGYTDAADVHNYWVKTPLYGGAFLQDRMEYRQIVVNAGVRVDFHRPDKYFDIPSEQHADWMGSNAALLYQKTRAVRPPTKWAVSPRFGVSHPITAESKLFFNYGHFAQLPTSDQLYRTQSGLGEPLETFGNPWMDLPRTVAYELGYERNLGRSYLFNGTAYFKDIDREVDEDTRLYLHDATDRSTRFSTNGVVKDVRGVEVSVRKAQGRFITGFASYEFRQERRRRVGWDQLFDAKTVTAAPTRLIENNPSAANPRFRARPLWKAGLNLRTPIDYGGDARLLKGGWEVNVFYRRQAGNWFNYNPANDLSLRDIDNVQWMDDNRLDLRLSKTFHVAASPTFYLEVANLFNFKNPNTNTTRVFEHLGDNTTANFRRYMEALGWKLDTGGKLQKGDRPGKELGPDVMPKRDYLFYVGRRDITFGLRFAY